MPRVSIVIPSFNHGRFIRRAIDSVLAQTVDDTEVIVVDDGSTDNSADVIRQVQESNVRSIIFDQNKGACTALNVGLQAATAPLAAICNSDDEWVPTKLEEQLKVLEKQPELGAVFSNVAWIKEDDTEIELTGHNLSDFFNPHNRSREEWLASLVEDGNRLCHPSILIRREVYDRCGWYDNRFRQVPDYDMWLRVVQKYQIKVIDSRLVRFRVCDGFSNTSAPSSANKTRTMNELALVMANLFDHMERDCFAGSFGTKKPLLDQQFSLPVEKILYLTTRISKNELLFRYIGLMQFLRFLETEGAESALRGYGLKPQDVHTVAGISSPFLARFDALSEAELACLTTMQPDKETQIREFWKQKAESLDEAAQVQSLKRQLVDLEQANTDKINRLKKHIADLEKAREEQHAIAASLREECRATGEQNRSLLKDMGELESSLNAIKNSSSWRLTAPLRKLNRLKF